MKIIHKILMKLPEEFAHDLVIKALSLDIIRLFIPKIHHTYKNLEQNLFNTKFRNPIGLAGGFDKNGVAVNSLSKFGFGFIEIGTVTPRPQYGNPKPRLFRISELKAIVNCFGFNNDGMVKVKKNLQKIKKNRNFVLGVNIGKNKNTEDEIGDYTMLFSQFYELADYITINISSPNTPGLRDMQNKENLIRLISSCKHLQKSLSLQYNKYTPLIVKISPDLSLTQLKDICKVLLDLAVDGIIVSNTTINEEISKKLNSKKKGGISGYPLKKLADNILANVYNITEGKIPIIASGGVISKEDALNKIKLGASLVQVYTGLIYNGFDFVQECNDYINQYIKENNYNNISEIIGSIKKIPL